MPAKVNKSQPTSAVAPKNNKTENSQLHRSHANDGYVVAVVCLIVAVHFGTYMWAVCALSIHCHSWLWSLQRLVKIAM